jgi:hypothetical protein
MRRLISKLLVIALLFQSLALAPLALAACPHAATSQHACTCCPDGITPGACVGACAAAAIPASTPPFVTSLTHDSPGAFRAVPVRGPSYTPLDPPPIR